MTSKRTRHALISSVISLVLCCSMLIGTTFAWFTDEVTSENNIIKSGTLDVEMWYGDTRDAITNDASKGAIFDYKYWEPGYVDIKYITLKNVGDLAFKYQMHVIPENASSDGMKLAEVIDVYAAIVADGNFTAPTRDTVENLNKLGTLKELMANANGVDDGILLPADGKGSGDVVVPTGAEYYTGDVTVCLALKMQESAGNEYQKLSIGDGFDVQVLATQYIYENDSFDNKYDDGLNPSVSYLFSGLNLNQSTTESGLFELSADIKTSDYGDDARYGWGYEYIVRNGADYTLNLNGKTITHDTINENANKNAFTYTLVANNPGTKLTINGDGKIYANNSEGNTCILQGKDGTLITVNGGDYQADNGIAVWAGAGSHIVINGGSFVNGNAKTDHELVYSSGGVIDIYGGFFHNTDGNYTLNVEDRNRATGFINVYGGTYVNFDPSTGGQDPNNIKVADGFHVEAEVQANGDTWYTVLPNEEIETADQLKSALANGGNYTLKNDIALTETAAVGSGKTVVLYMNNKTISGTLNGTGNQDLFLVKGNLTMKDGAVELAVTQNQGWNAMSTIFDITAGGVVTLEDVVAENKGGTDMNFVAHLNNWGTATLNVYDSTLEATYIPVRVFNSGNDMNNVTIKNTQLVGKYCLWVHNYTAEGKDDSTLNFSIYGNGNTFTNSGKAPVLYGFSDSIYFNAEGVQIKSVSSQDDLNSALTGTAEVDLGDGNYTLPSVSNGDVTISGSKDTVITVNKPNCSGSDVTFNGVTIKGSGYATGVQHVDTVTYNDAAIVGEMCLYGEKVVFNNCTFELNSQYVWTYGAKEVEFNNCTFNTNGKAILIYNEGAGASKVTVKGCAFNATAGAKAGAIANQNCAAIEIDNFQSSGTGTAHVLITEGNTYSENFSGEWRIKNYVSGNAVTVNGTEYTQIAVNGKLMTIDADKNVTVAE